MKRKKKMAGDKIAIRRWKDENHELIAFIPGAPANSGHIMSYMTVGQHGEASWPDILSRTRPVRASEPDVQDFLAELRSIGYKPRLIQRIPHGSLYWVQEQRKRDKARWG